MIVAAVHQSCTLFQLLTPSNLPLLGFSTERLLQRAPHTKAHSSNEFIDPLATSPIWLQLSQGRKITLMSPTHVKVIRRRHIGNSCSSGTMSLTVHCPCKLMLKYSQLQNLQVQKAGFVWSTAGPTNSDLLEAQAEGQTFHAASLRLIPQTLAYFTAEQGCSICAEPSMPLLSIISHDADHKPYGYTLSMF